MCSFHLRKSLNPKRTGGDSEQLHVEFFFFFFKLQGLFQDTVEGGMCLTEAGAGTESEGGTGAAFNSLFNNR